jgi:hypothetical protein
MNMERIYNFASDRKTIIVVGCILVTASIVMVSLTTDIIPSRFTIFVYFIDATCGAFCADLTIMIYKVLYKGD